MGYPTKIQVIKRTNSEQWFINFPAAIAHAMEFDKGETVEWVIENKNKLILKRQQQKIVQVKKKTERTTLMQEFDNLFSECGTAFKQPRSSVRAHKLAYGLLNCSGRHTLTGMISSAGEQFLDWSTNYRLFQGETINTDTLFSTVIKSLLEKEKYEDNNIYVHMDDTLLSKTGKKIVGTAWRRDPLGPPFHTNFIWGQRFIQLSIALPEKSGASRSRAIPVDFYHCPSVKKPKRTDSQEKWNDFKEKKKKINLSLQGVERIKQLRNKIDNLGAKELQIVLGVDGSYTNANVLRNKPPKVTLIGRIRKDTALNKIPGKSEGKAGRKRIYGQALPKPEEIRKSDEYPWQEVKAWAAGKTHNFNLKIVNNVRWRKAGNENLKLIIIRPLGYRLTKKSKLLYRQPAYLICTDPNLEIEKVLQAYLWRWEIEVNFREEKTLLGCGQAQVRTKEPVEKVPAFTVAVYSLLQLAAHRVRETGGINHLPSAKWYSHKNNKRETTGDILNAFKAQMLSKTMDINFYDFVNLQNSLRIKKNYVDPIFSAHFYHRN